MKNRKEKCKYLGPPIYNSNVSLKYPCSHSSWQGAEHLSLERLEFAELQYWPIEAGMGSPLFSLGDSMLVIIIPFILVLSRDLWEVPGSPNSLSCWERWSPDPEVLSLCVLEENLIVGAIMRGGWKVVMTAFQLTSEVAVTESELDHLK